MSEGVSLKLGQKTVVEAGGVSAAVSQTSPLREIVWFAENFIKAVQKSLFSQIKKAIDNAWKNFIQLDSVGLNSGCWLLYCRADDCCMGQIF